MEKVLFMKAFIQGITKGKVFCRVFAQVLRVLAVILGIAAFVGWVLMWKFVFEIPAAGVVGGIIFQLVFIVAIYMVIHAVFLRAYHISKVDGGTYPVVPVVSIFLKLLGEVYATFVAAVAIGGGLLIWFAGRYSLDLLKNVSGFMPKYSGGETFIGGLLLLIGGLIFAFFALVSFYLLSELFVAIVDTAENTKVLKKGGRPAPVTKAK